MSDWPKHPDGTNKMVGEMDPEEKRRVLREAAERYKDKCRSTQMQNYIDKIRKL